MQTNAFSKSAKQRPISRWRAFIVYTVALLLISSRSLPAWADDSARSSERDLAVLAGTASGSVKVLQNGKSTAYQVGGVLVGIAQYHDLSSAYEALLQADLLLDMVNHQVLRESLEVGFGWHLLGGSRRFQLGSEKVQVTSQYNSALTLGMRAAISLYADASPTNPADSFSGSVLETKVGLSYRYEITASSALLVSLFVPAIVVPASINGLTPALTEISLGWRLWF